MQFFLFLLLLFSLSASLHGAAPFPAAQMREISSDERWLRILFYERHSTFRGPHGLVDDPGFYLAKDGKTDPLAEMEATLTAFEAAQNSAEPDAHALCRFPARREFLEEQFPGLAAELPKVDCPRFSTWWQDRRYESVSLVFSSFYPDNPASMFGHIFLRLHRSKAGQGSDLLDDSINFAAFTDTNNPFVYNFKGVFGYFPGRFSLMPYYMKIQEYNNFESRDLWEYGLKATPAQIKHLLLSVWEFGPHFANYYYFDDNCSYVMLMLMETADLNWNLTGRVGAWSTPSSCLKAVVDQEAVVQKSRFRPSALSRFQERYDGMSATERERFLRLFEAGKADPAETPRVMDAALEYIDFQEKLAGTQAPVRYASVRNSVLMQRTQTRAAPEPLRRAPDDRDPRHAVAESWMMFSGAERSDGGGAFPRLSWQPVLHDLLGDNHGFAEDMQLQIMPMTFSLDPESQAIALDRLDMLNVITVQPYNRSIKPNSWMLQWAYQRQVLCQGETREFCPEARVSYSRGAAIATGVGDYAPILAGFLHLGLGGTKTTGLSTAFLQAGPEFLIHGGPYALRSLWARRWNETGDADWYLKNDFQFRLSLSRVQQLRLQASWEQKKSVRTARLNSDIQLGILQHF